MRTLSIPKADTGGYQLPAPLVRNRATGLSSRAMGRNGPFSSFGSRLRRSLWGRRRRLAMWRQFWKAALWADSATR